MPAGAMSAMTLRIHSEFLLFRRRESGRALRPDPPSGEICFQVGHDIQKMAENRLGGPECDGGSVFGECPVDTGRAVRRGGDVCIGTHCHRMSRKPAPSLLTRQQAENTVPGCLGHIQTNGTRLRRMRSKRVKDQGNETISSPGINR